MSGGGISEDEDEDALDEDFEESEEFFRRQVNSDGQHSAVNTSQAGLDFPNISSIMQTSPSPFVKRQHTKINEDPNEDEDDEETKHPHPDEDDEANLENVQHGDFRDLHENSFKNRQQRNNATAQDIKVEHRGELRVVK
jgi:hypothetical protein